MVFIPLDIDQTPAGIPPPGIIPNFDPPYNGGPNFYYLGSFFLSLVVIVSLLRLLVKVSITKERSWDDCKFESQLNNIYADQAFH